MASAFRIVMKRAEFHRIRLLPPAPEQVGARLSPLPEGGFECWHTLPVKFSKDARIFIAPLREGGYWVLPCAKHRGENASPNGFCAQYPIKKAEALRLLLSAFMMRNPARVILSGANN